MPADPTRPGYNFAGWNTQAGGGGTAFDASTPIPASIPVFAQWTSVGTTVTVTFNPNGAGVVPPAPQTRTVSTGQNLTINSQNQTMPANPTRAGYVFAGWFDTSAASGGTEFTAATHIPADIPVWARWTANSTVTVTFNANSGTLAAGGNTRTVNSGQTLALNSQNVSMPGTPVRAGYTFAGWFDTSAAAGGSEFIATTAITTDRTVWARWTSNPTVTVTFNANSGILAAGGASRTVQSGQNLTANSMLPPAAMPGNPSRVGYVFASWNTQANGGGTVFDAATAIAADLTVYAQWTANAPVTVTFMTNDGTPAVTASRTVNADQNLTANSQGVAMPTPPSRVNWTFAGWNTQADGLGTEFTAASAIPADISVFAQWDANITFVLNYGANAQHAVRTVRDGTSIGSANWPAAPSRGVGIHFAGWSTQQNDTIILGNEFESNTVVTGGHMTVYAQWHVNVTFNLRDAPAPNNNASEVRTVRYGEAVGAAVPAVTRAGAAFIGWSSVAIDTSRPLTGAFTPATPVTGDRTVYAQWDSTVIFNLDGGNIGGVTTSPTHILATDTAVGLANMPATPTRAGIGFPGSFEFHGWALTSGGDPVEDMHDEIIVADIEVFARWMIPVPGVDIGTPGGGGITFPNPDGPDHPNPDPDLVVVSGPDADGGITIIIPPPQGGNHVFPQGPGEVTVNTPAGYVVDDQKPPFVNDDGHLVVVIMLPQFIFNLNGGEVLGDWRPVVVSLPLGSTVSPADIPFPRNPGFRFRGWQQNPTLTAAQVADIPAADVRTTFVAVWEDRSGEGGSGAIGGGITGGGVGVGGAGVGPGTGVGVSGVGVGGAGVDYDDYDYYYDEGAHGDQDHVNYNPPTGGVHGSTQAGSDFSGSAIAFPSLSLLVIAAVAFIYMKRRDDA